MTWKWNKKVLNATKLLSDIKLDADMVYGIEQEPMVLKSKRKKLLDFWFYYKKLFCWSNFQNGWGIVFMS